MDDTSHIRVWVRARWQFADGHEITRTVKRDIAQRAPTGDPEDSERRAILRYEFLEELRAAGHDFPEGHGTLVAILGTMTD